jgi:hypothetical protein
MLQPARLPAAAHSWRDNGIILTPKPGKEFKAMLSDSISAPPE